MYTGKSVLRWVGIAMVLGLVLTGTGCTPSEGQNGADAVNSTQTETQNVTDAVNSTPAEGQGVSVEDVVNGTPVIELVREIETEYEDGCELIKVKDCPPEYDLFLALKNEGSEIVRMDNLSEMKVIFKSNSWSSVAYNPQSARMLVTQGEPTQSNVKLICIDPDGTILWKHKTDPIRSINGCGDHWLCTAASRDSGYELGVDGDVLNTYSYSNYGYSLYSVEGEKLYLCATIPHRDGPYTSYTRHRAVADLNGDTLLEEKVFDGDLPIYLKTVDDRSYFFAAPTDTETIEVCSLNSKYEMEMLGPIAVPEGLTFGFTSAYEENGLLFVFAGAFSENGDWTANYVLILDENFQLLREVEIPIPSGECVISARSGEDGSLRLLTAKGTTMYSGSQTINAELANLKVYKLSWE